MKRRGSGGRHLKRKPAPAFWPIPKKKHVWAVRPVPGPHPIDRCIPLLVIIRDILKLAEVSREARIIIKQGLVKVDGVVRREPRFPVGLMDVLSLEEANTHYRILPTHKGLSLHKINNGEAKFKLCRIENKTTVKGGRTQLNLHDGRNILLSPEEEDVYKTLDVLMIEVPSQTILKHLRIGEGMYAIVIGGKNIGKHGKILGIEQVKGEKRRRHGVVLQSPDGEEFRTILDYVFVVGEEEPLISLPSKE
ncbi:30S ribosomal protein S4e [Candidatus Bathyarchaeota archaeon]|nr:MAG: 30S ribosomal protein S4e [Candidatus Bathyarchaeota archaeon]